ncbi:squalene-associated fad-dependent desaturase : Squalene-associated FAD-dependent desaturase OS=Singulisphaera acidiphila (strain ATCC BAA-1392 / DSM 18658 / VKM B-2454 / MOB10) GN=Sinac_5222 PE=4 SV=1: NAD_binding_8: Amino_oxidase [Gemmata massiliana]|uniref:Amine oxidase domain-containing protein n=1 Tax=Gemmata massiliana TaxID=1210884 RepID=A0A6P2DI28_9BACT|nr:hydroxysqualene dehydroxylase HpnE [Gemmata massiliana]VTS02178.1 squalene-associated fad-dependent desaturase : Squalene-associated FAD-dependent desaturase OS=Singulisphaera acidiphila (strain ATCC BAA-1392 / DSM 18658 / VKM B-2454 / MOB10) GN=Sinac_5222 PE=4 SV=1: NAD_binding_8: Amino_oxidase [Gemmata massiliana]
MVTGTAVVVGGGLAGLAAAAGLAQHGFQVTVLESRGRLGGRAGSFVDPTTGQMVDACQHVSMGCCTNLAHFLRTVGVDHLLAPQPKLYFVTPDRRASVFKADPWPAPLHLGRALMGAHYLTPLDKLRVGYGLVRMLAEHPDADPPLLPWLRAHRQNDRTIERFWAIVLTSALNETVDRVGLKYARKVFRDGFVRHRDGFTVHVPTVPLGRLYGDELCAWFAAHNVEVRENAGVKRLIVGEPPPPSPLPEGKGEKELSAHVASNPAGSPTGSPFPDRRGDGGGGIRGIELRDGSTLSADWYVLAVPFDRVADLLPEDLVAREPYFGNVKNLTASPITSVHLWFDRATMKLPHAVLIDCLGQWVFDRGEVAPGEFYLQVVVSAARDLKGLGRDEIQRRIVEELGRVFPPVSAAKLLRAKVVTEHTATFSAVPGIDQWRPVQASPIANLALAGDWTATGWPATMEGAVRSGYLAAEAILTRAGQSAKLVQPDLGA